MKKQLRMIDLIVMAGQKRLSPRTGFIHLYPNEEFSDTIPIYENFCFAFALMRQKTAESFTSAKELMSRLLGFQAQNGNFPVFIHEFPTTHDFNLGLKVGAILVYTLKLFPTLLGDLKSKIEEALEKILSVAPEKPFWLNRYKALKGHPVDPQPIQSFSEWTDWIITMQLSGQTEFSLPFDPDLQLFKPQTAQETNEPRPHPIEWLLAEENYSPRLLKDHPLQLLCAPLFPLQFTESDSLENSFRFFWKGTTTIHSLVGTSLNFILKEQEMGRNDLFEASLFCNRSKETQIFVENQKATTFRFGEKITIQTPYKTIELTFYLREGEGDFYGHIFPANRPSQTAKGFEAYDWQIGLRTLRRSQAARIEIQMKEFSIEAQESLIVT